MNSSFTKSKGFTLIETLVAISILLVAVAGPLVVVSQALTSSYYARDQITAFYLAQDAIEYLRNEKDKEIKEVGTKFSRALLDCSSACTVDTIYKSVSTESGAQPTLLKYQDGVYSYQGDDSSRFSRTIKITPSSVDADDATNEEFRVDVTVEWRTNLNGVATRSITLTEYLYAVTSL